MKISSKSRMGALLVLCLASLVYLSHIAPGQASTGLQEDDQLTFGGFMRRMEHIARSSGVLLTDQHFEPEAAPRQMVAHATSSVCLNHGVNACGFERTLGKIGFDLRGEGIHDDEFAAIHASIIRPDALLPFRATWENLTTAAKLRGCFFTTCGANTLDYVPG